MKSVNAFFTPATKKVKYYCEGEKHQTCLREQVGELNQNMKRIDTREGQSTSSLAQGLWFVLRICDIALLHYKLASSVWFEFCFDFSYTTLRYT